MPSRSASPPLELLDAWLDPARDHADALQLKMDSSAAALLDVHERCARALQRELGAMPSAPANVAPTSEEQAWLERQVKASDAEAVEGAMTAAFGPPVGPHRPTEDEQAWLEREIDDDYVLEQLGECGLSNPPSPVARMRRSPMARSPKAEWTPGKFQARGSPFNAASVCSDFEFCMI